MGRERDARVPALRRQDDPLGILAEVERLPVFSEGDGLQVFPVDQLLPRIRETADLVEILLRQAL